jgi:hypothetical protein
LASGFINGNSFQVTVLGTFDYIKNFLAIFIYAAFFRDFNDFKRIFRLLLIIALLLGTVALIQFIWAMGSIYVLGKNITDPGAYIFFKINDINVFWRFGIFRASSLTYHPYILGLFNLFILTIYFYTIKKTRIAIIGPLLSGVIASVSRIVYGGLMFIILLQFIKRKKWFVPLFLILLLLALTQVNSSDNLNLSGMLNSYFPVHEESVNMHDIRMYTRYKSIELWKDHPLWGVGPGMFGGIVASKYRSYVYEEYNVLNQAYIHRIGGIEQFWFEIMAEMGIVGALFFGSLLITLFVILNQLEKQAVSEEMKGLFLALKVFIGCILIYSLGSGLNIAPVLFTYCAFVGIGLGSFNNQVTNKIKIAQ